jgi:hypothetical protein
VPAVAIVFPLDKRTASCLEQTDAAIAATNTRLYVMSETFNRAVDRYVRNGPCRNIVSETRGELAAFQGWASAYRLVVAGVRAHSAKMIRAAVSKGEYVLSHYANESNHTQLLDFQVDCR